MPTQPTVKPLPRTAAPSALLAPRQLAVRLIASGNHYNGEAREVI